MSRAIVNVATTPGYQRGQRRLEAALRATGDICSSDPLSAAWFPWENLPQGCPPHRERPYAFKAYGLKAASLRQCDSLLWLDSSIVPVQPLAPLWERIERDGYWISRNGWSNYEWTAEAAYPALFGDWQGDAERLREVNRKIPHVVATAFGLSLRHPIGRAILDEYYRLASETDAFCGPWRNEPTTPCGPADVHGHRHDQTALSVIAWRLGAVLTDPPDVFAYANRDGSVDPRTILEARGIE